MTQQPEALPEAIAHLDCDHPSWCAETGEALPGWGEDGPFVDVSGTMTRHQRLTGPTYKGPGPFTTGYDVDTVAADAMAEGTYRHWDGNGFHNHVDQAVTGPLAERLAELDRLTTGKNEGYAGAQPTDRWANYRGFTAFGRTALDSALARFNEKHNRAAVLYSNRGADRVGESLRDTLMDAAAIALIAVELLDEEGCLDCGD